MPRYLLHLPIALILSSLAGFTAAQQDEVSIPSSLLVSASSGDAESQYLLGQSLDQGQLFGAEIREAFNWYKQSADQGYALAETVVGQMYVEGRGVPQNFSEGEGYLLRAASKGLSAAQLVLGGIKLESEEFPQAYLLFSLAMTLAEDEETYNEAIAGRGEAETNLQEAEITVLQSRATTCIESEFARCDFGPLSLEDLSFLDVVEPEVEVEAEEAEEIETPLNIRVVENTPADDSATTDEPRIFQSATFSDKEELISSIKPERSGDNFLITMFCFTPLDERGKSPRDSEGGCREVGEPPDNITSVHRGWLKREVVRKINRSTFRPASVNGEKKAVRFYFYVTVEELDNEFNITIGENHLYNEELFGQDYVGAQVYQLESQPDIEVQQCDLREGRQGREYAYLGLTVARDGGISQARLLEADRDVGAECLNEIIRYLESTYGFIPAHAGGTPVDAVYVGSFCFGKCGRWE